MKTTRNCLAVSGNGRATRCVWNNGSDLLMSYIANLYYESLDIGLKYLPKLTNKHFQLTSYSVLNVRLAVQILSFSVGKVLQEFGPQDAAGTAKLCMLMDSFFDCLNVRNTDEFKTKRKPNLKPYPDPQDEHFDLLKYEFLKYFKD